MPHMCHPIGVSPGFSYYPFSGIHGGPFPYGIPPPHFQHPAPGLQDRMEFLETQLARLELEKDSMHAVIQYLLPNSAPNTRTKQSCRDCGLLKIRLALQRKANHRLKGKYQNAAASLLAKRIQLRRLRHTLGTAVSTRYHHKSSSSGDETLVSRDSPETDLLGGTIPISIIERFPASSSFHTDPPSADTLPDLENSDDDQSSASEAESVDCPPSSKCPRLPVISTQPEGCKPLSGALLPGDGDTCDFAGDSFSSEAEVPYVRYFSGAIISTSAKSEDVKGNTEHMGDLATSSSSTWPIRGPVSVAAGPHASRVLRDDELFPSISPETAGRTSSLSPTGSSLESGDKALGDIPWTFADSNHHSNKRIFATEAERESAIATNRRSAGREDLTFPDLFRYGIRYNPEHTVQNVYRTVLIEGLPDTVTLEELLNKVRGGCVLSTKLCDTYTITGSCSALVTFLNESAAHQYQDFAASHTIYVSGLAVKVSMLSTPTWPMKIPLRKAIFDYHHTRCLEVTNLPHHITLSALQLDLRVCSSMDCDMVEYLQVRHDGILDIRFSSVNAAGQAFGLLTCRAKYRPCSVRFSPDPCGLPLDTLLEPDESDLCDEIVTFDHDMSVEQFAEEEGGRQDEEHAEEEGLDGLERFSSSENESGASAPVSPPGGCIKIMSTSLLD